MAEQIKVDTQKLKAYSGDIKNSYKNMCACLSESRTTVKNIRTTWSGAGAEEFYARFDSIITKCEEVLNVVNTYAATLSESADVYSVNEKKIADGAGKLKINLK